MVCIVKLSFIRISLYINNVYVVVKYKKRKYEEKIQTKIDIF